MLLLQEYVNSKQKILKEKKIPCFKEFFCVDILPNNMTETELNRSVYDFSVVYNIIDANNIINIHKYFVKYY